MTRQGWHRHRFSTNQERTERSCVDCDERQEKHGGRWVSMTNAELTLDVSAIKRAIAEGKRVENTSEGAIIYHNQRTSK